MTLHNSTLADIKSITDKRNQQARNSILTVVISFAIVVGVIAFFGYKNGISEKCEAKYPINWNTDSSADVQAKMDLQFFCREGKA